MVIKERTKDIEFPTHFRLVIVDPNNDNIQAIRCYKKSGFEESNYSEAPDYLIMIRTIDLN